jgi:DNA replication and repair protein RecF
MDGDYLQQLILYNKVLQQRNSLLRRFAEQGKPDWPLLEVLDEQLVLPGNLIHQSRKRFCDRALPLVQQFYRQIADSGEEVSLQYESRLNDMLFEDLLNQFRERICCCKGAMPGCTRMNWVSS